MTPREHFDALLAELPAARAGNMFGYPSLNVGRKAFAFFDKDSGAHAAFKLPPKLLEGYLTRDDYAHFDPAGGKPMRAWVKAPASVAAEEWQVLSVSRRGPGARGEGGKPTQSKAAYEHLLESMA